MHFLLTPVCYISLRAHSVDDLNNIGRRIQSIMLVNTPDSPSFYNFTFLLHHEDVCGSGGVAPPFLTSKIYGGNWLASRPCRFIPRERAPYSHWIGGPVGPRAGLEALKWIKVFAPDGNQTPATQPVANRYTDSSTPTPTFFFFSNSHSGGWIPNWVHSPRRPLNGLLYLSRVIMMMENLVE
jgi:hypothetical protein